MMGHGKDGDVKSHMIHRKDSELLEELAKGFRVRAPSPPSSAKLDLNRTLGLKKRLPGLAVKATISDNRTGNCQARLLSALEKRAKDPLLGIKSVRIAANSRKRAPC